MLIAPSNRPGAPMIRFALVLALGLSVAAPITAHAQTPPGAAAAARGYEQLAKGDAAAAAASAERAVTAAPGNLDYRLLWTDALLRAGRPAEALAALGPVSGLADYRVQTRRAEAAAKTGDKAQAAEAYAAAAPLATEAASREYLTRARILALVELDRRDQARDELRTAWKQGVLPGGSPLDAAMLAIAVGDDASAQQAFAAAEMAQPLSGRVALDAAYSARRAGRDRDAVRWFKQGLDTTPADQLPPQQRFGIQREIATLERRWGASASISRGVTSTASSSTPGAENVVQAGAEVWRRLGGYNNGRPLDVFGRIYGALDADGGGATGGDTMQGWIGLRWKPFSQANLYLEGSKMIALGDLARDDVMLRVVGSAESGGDLRFDRDSWATWRIYGDLARLVEDEQTLGVLSGAAGWTWRTSERDMLTPGIGARLYYDSLLGDEVAAGAGPRLGWRHWYGGDRYHAPSSYFDLYLGYDFSLAGGDRGEGVTAGVTLVH